MSGTLTRSLPSSVAFESPPGEADAVFRGIPTLDQFTARANRARSLLNRLAAKGKGFYLDPVTRLTCFKKLENSVDASRVIIMAETIFRHTGEKERAALLLEEIAHPLELLEKTNGL